MPRLAITGRATALTDGANHVDFPASSPHILACGGTSLQSSNGAIESETVWNDGAQGGAGGGGFSAQFALPPWQASAKIKPPSGGGRGVPDVSGDADPETGYNVLVDGETMVIGGTSAVAPLWSGLIALLIEKLGKPLGLVQPTLYGLPRQRGCISRYYQRIEWSIFGGAGVGCGFGIRLSVRGEFVRGAVGRGLILSMAFTRV